jgi:Mg-chelatase subunit ChlD
MSKRRSRESGVAIYITTAMLVMIIPTIGLTIDGGLLYVVKCGLQGSVDGAALSGARGLARGTNSSQQVASAQNDAAIYVKLNFPRSYFFSSDANVDLSTDVTVDLSQQYYRTVSVTAHVTEPTLFMRWLNIASTNVTATATAVRRDTNVMIVMDRSGSLANSGSCEPLKAAAQNFTNFFSEGRDNVGLITFATSSRVDFQLSNNFKTASPNISTILGNIACNGATNTSQGLWTGYQALAALNQPGAMNVILLFTDGDPTATTNNFAIKSTSPCTSHANQVGVFSFTGDPGSATWGLADYQARPQPWSGDTSTYPSGSTGCSYRTRYSNVGNDVTGVPVIDYWGNHLNNGYLPVTVNGGLLAAASNSTNAQNFNRAAINAADDAGYRILSGANPNNGSPALSGVFIYAIGLGMSSSQSTDFLQRVSNDPASSRYNSSQSSGLFVLANNASDLSAAFNRVASEILRISR